LLGSSAVDKKKVATGSYWTGRRSPQFNGYKFPIRCYKPYPISGLENFSPEKWRLFYITTYGVAKCVWGVNL